MINALLIDSNESHLESNRKLISDNCSNVAIEATSTNLNAAFNLIGQRVIQLLVINIDKADPSLFLTISKVISKEVEVIVLAPQRDLAYEAIKFSATGFVLKPIDPIELISSVRSACKRIHYSESVKRNQLLLKKLNHKLSNEDLIGIPTMDGYDFVRVQNILRCRALERCTQIVTTENPKIISSYNLGEFKKLLEPFGFFSPHKSHLINLDYMIKYHRNGLILMHDDSTIPVARSKRNDFLKKIKHL